MDIEGGNPGWGDLSYGSTAYTWNRDDFNGFWNTVVASDDEIGMYSSQYFWNLEIGTNNNATGTWEWASTLSWSGYSNNCAQAWQSTESGVLNTPLGFAGQTYGSSDCAAFWQFISGSADYDQVYTGLVDEYSGTSTCK